MNPGSEGEHAIDSAVASLYRGPPEDFVSRRDALARELRSTGERDSASVVKALKKPSRTAWALNVAVVESPHLVTALVAAIRETTVAQSSGADVRASISGLRTTAREFAVEAARVAANAGHDVDAGVLVAALFAVLGQSESFDNLRRGRLADVPGAGGLDLLGSLPVLPGDDAPFPPPGPRRDAPPAAGSRPGEARRVEARARAEEAAATLASAKGRASDAADVLRDAEASLGAAEQRVREAEEEAGKARGRRDRARQDAEAATAAVEKAQLAVDRAGRAATTSGASSVRKPRNVTGNGPGRGAPLSGGCWADCTEAF